MGHIRASRPAAGAVAVLAAAVLVAACSSSSSSSSASSPGSAAAPAAGQATSGGAAMTSVVVGSLPLIDTAGLQVAIKEGFFAHAGLNVTVRSVAQSTAAIPEMVHGSIDIIGGANYVSFFEADASGTLPTVVLAQASDCTPDSYGVVALPSSGITKPADLAGKTIAVNLTKNVQTLTTNAVLAADGVNTSSISYVETPFPDMVAALKAHRVDAVSVVEPFLAAALAAGGKLVTTTCTGPAAAFPLSGYLTTKSWATQHAATARAFAKALNEGQAYADAHPDVVRSLLPTYTTITAKAAATVPLTTYPDTLTTAPMQQVAKLMHSGGLAAPSDISSVVFH